MAKKKQLKKTNTNSVLFGIIGIVVVVLGIIFISIEWNKRKEVENVKGESTTISNDGKTQLSCIKPPEPCKETNKRRCPMYSPPRPGTIICTPTPTPNLSEDELHNNCLKEGGEIIHFLSKPSSGYSFSFNINRSEACYLPTLTPDSGCVPKPPCVDGIVDPNTGEKRYCDPPPGTVFCNSTPTPPSITSESVSCGWCDENCVDTTLMGVCLGIGSPEGYSCVEKDNVCVKEKSDGSTQPTIPRTKLWQNLINTIRGWFRFIKNE